MLVLLATGIEELDKGIAKSLEQKNVTFVGECYYREGLLPLAKDRKAEIIVVSPHLPGATDLVDLLKDLRMAGLGVVLLPGRKGHADTLELAQKAVALGVYDLVWDPVNPALVTEAVLHPGTLAEAGVEPAADVVSMDEVLKQRREEGLLTRLFSRYRKKAISAINREDADRQVLSKAAGDWVDAVEEPPVQRQEQPDAGMVKQTAGLAEMGQDTIDMHEGLSRGNLDIASSALEKLYCESGANFVAYLISSNDGCGKYMVKYMFGDFCHIFQGKEIWFTDVGCKPQIINKSDSECQLLRLAQQVTILPHGDGVVIIGSDQKIKKRGLIKQCLANS